MTEDRKAENSDILEEAFRNAGRLPKIDFPTFLVSMFHSALVIFIKSLDETNHFRWNAIKS